MYERTFKIIENRRDELKDLSKKIYHNPELGFEEKFAASLQVDILQKNKFSVQREPGGISTAYKAVYGKNPAPNICIMSEYDALPSMGHACGHNLICTSAIAAGLAARQIIEEDNLEASLTVMGTPGEESKGGKVILLRENAFKGINAALICHPLNRTRTDPGCLSVYRYKITFRGHASHASMAPEHGINALDAVQLLFCGINAWRQQLPEASRVHGIVTNGGVAPNIIPDKAECSFYLRADNEDVQHAMEKRFLKIAEGAAMMTGTRHHIEKEKTSYMSGIFNKPFNTEFFKLAQEAGMDPLYEAGGGRFSTDFGNVSHAIPSANFCFQITKENYMLHTPEFKEAAGSSFAFEQTLRNAAIMASIAVRYLSDISFRESVHDDFELRIEKDSSFDRLI